MKHDDEYRTVKVEIDWFHRLINLKTRRGKHHPIVKSFLDSMEKQDYVLRNFRVSAHVARKKPNSYVYHIVYGINISDKGMEFISGTLNRKEYKWCKKHEFSVNRRNK